VVLIHRFVVLGVDLHIHKFVAPIPCISLRIDDFLFQFPPKSTNSSRRFSRKSPNRLKPDLRPAKAGPLLPPAGQCRLAPSLRLDLTSLRVAHRDRTPVPRCSAPSSTPRSPRLPLRPPLAQAAPAWPISLCPRCAAPALPSRTCNPPASRPLLAVRPHLLALSHQRQQPARSSSPRQVPPPPARARPPPQPATTIHRNASPALARMRFQLRARPATPHLAVAPRLP
jgi:hypothetical protein